MMRRELTEQDILTKSGDYKTVFAVEQESEKKYVHLFGYIYCSDDLTFKPYRNLEYTFLYIPIEEAVEKGLNKAEMEYQETVKQYVADIDYEEILSIYNNYDNGKPPMMLDKLTLDTPVGTYILKD